MALKPGRKVENFLIDYIYDDTITADVTNGGVVSLKTGGSGEALDTSLAVCNYHATGSGVTALGVLIPKISTDNVSSVPRNFHQNLVPKGSKVEIANKGWVLTNMYQGTPTAGSKAELAMSGFVALSTNGYTALSHTLVGYFMSTPDEDGYVKLYVDCPSR